ncbi:hypothetical protein ACFSQ3_08685 [Sphingobacterium corticis]|uniref:Uncharacterized protein n=1 Tax=Sphingobacterium corticis TaxID=1812823 RepID=A0ABW5NLA1_9SPHI
MNLEQREPEVVYQFSADVDDCRALFIKSKFKEKVVNERLDYSWNWYLDGSTIKDGIYNLNVYFEKNEGGSKITVVKTNQSEDESTHPHSDG